MTFRVLRNASFRSLWAAGVLSKLGSEFSRIALLLYLFEAQQSVASLALLIALKTIPAALFAPAAGLLADRIDKRGLLIAADLIRAMLVASIALWPEPLVIYVVTLLHSLASAVFDPAKSASIPLMVRKEDVAAANGLDQSANNLTMILGPVVGAFFFLRLGLGIAMLLDAASFMLSALLLVSVHIRPIAQGRPVNVGASFSDMRAGWQYVSREPALLYLVGLFFFSMLCGGIWVPLAPFFIRDFLHASESALGWQLAFFGSGGILGGLLGPLVLRRWRSGQVLLLALVAEGVHLLLYSFIPDLFVSLLVLFTWGVSVSLISISSVTLLQLTVAEEFLGRVFSIVAQAENAAMALAMLFAAAGEPVPSELMFRMAGLVYLLIMASAWCAGPGQAIVQKSLEQGAGQSVGNERGA